MTVNNPVVTNIEARHVWYLPPATPGSSDYHYVKEVHSYSDGSRVNNIKLIKDFKRSFWVTKPGKRLHRGKKELELLDNLNRYESTQSQLAFRVAQALEKPWFQGSLKDLHENPYLYGTDISSTALVKASYSRKNGDFMSPSSVAVFDIETYMGTGTICVATLSFGDKVYTAVDRELLKGRAVGVPDIRKAFDKYLAKYKDRVKNWEVEIVDSEIDILKGIFQRAHEWQPDIVAVWNINFDIPKVIAACNRVGLDPKELFSDPKLPSKFKYFRYKEAKKVKRTASGKETPINFADMWHTVFAPASFYWIDAMCSYRKLRTQKGELDSYALDYVLQLELGERKLNFSMADGYTDEAWHEFMQEEYPVEYIIYNVFDCISVELLDEKTMDLSLDLPISCKFSDYKDFESQPKRTVDELHFWTIENVKSVLATTSKDIITELDKLAPPNEDWIVNLKAYLLDDVGLELGPTQGDLITRFFIKNYDSDVSGAYPSNTIVFNISRETQRRIVCRIERKSINDLRNSGLNLSGGHTNAVEFCTTLFDLPNLDTLENAYLQHRARVN